MLIVSGLFVLALILLNGAFVMIEMSVVSSRRTKLQALAERGLPGARTALHLAENPTRFLSSIQAGITLISIFTGAYGEATIASQLAEVFKTIPVLHPYAEGLATGVVVVVIAYVSLVLGELAPKRLAQLFAETIAARTARPAAVLALIIAPFVTLLSVSTHFILRLMGVRDQTPSEVTHEEVEIILAEGASAGLIEPEEQEMIEEVMRLGDRPVRVAMTPRPEVYWINADDDHAILREEIRACPYARLVVAHGDDMDTPVGVVHKKDLLDAWLQHGESAISDLVALAQTPLFIPETTSVLKALERFKETRIHMAFVVDEFGAFQGVVTATDLLEMIAGDFPEAHDEEAPALIRPRDDGSFLVDGRADVEELASELDDDFGEAEGYHTVAGLILHTLSRLPEEGETVHIGRWRVEVVDMDDRRVDKLVFRKAEEAAA